MIFTGRTMDLLTTSEMAEKWNISRRRVTTLCQEGRIKGCKSQLNNVDFRQSQNAV